MLIKTRGIILRSIKYSETSMIVDILTEVRGLRTYIISGVRSKKAKVKASLLQTMTLVDLVVYDRQDNKLTRIKEIKAAHVYRSIPFDVVKGAVGLFMVELIRKSVQESEENTALFNFLYNTFIQLDTSEHSVANFHIAFMIELSGFLGFLPGGTFSDDTSCFDLSEGVFCWKNEESRYTLDEGQSKLLDVFLKIPINRCHEIMLNREERRAFLNEMIIFYRFHVENFESLNAHKVLETVLG